MNPHLALRAFVQQSGVSVKELADALGISRAYLYLLMDEGAKKLPHRNIAAAIEDLSGIPLLSWDEAFITERAA